MCYVGSYCWLIINIFEWECSLWSQTQWKRYSLYLYHNEEIWNLSLNILRIVGSFFLLLLFFFFNSWKHSWETCDILFKRPFYKITEVSEAEVGLWSCLSPLFIFIECVIQIIFILSYSVTIKRNTVCLYPGAIRWFNENDKHME